MTAPLRRLEPSPPAAARLSIETPPAHPRLTPGSPPGPLQHAPHDPTRQVEQVGPLAVQHTGLAQGRIARGAPADLIVFDAGKPWLCDRDQLLSRSKNSPFDGRRLQGRVARTLVGGKTVFER